MQRQPVDFISELRKSQIEGYRYITGKLDEIAKAKGLTMFGEPEPEWEFHQSVATYRACLPTIRTIALLPATDADVYPWCLDCNITKNRLGCDEVKSWLIPLDNFDFDRIDNRLAFISNWNDERMKTDWNECVLDPIKTHQFEWLKFIDSLALSVDEICSSLNPGGREAVVLNAMLKLKTYSPESRKTQQKILNLVPKGDSNDFRRVFKKLEKLNLVLKGNLGRGYFFTEIGLKVAQKMSAPQ